MNTYIKGFTFIIEKRKVFIEAMALDQTGAALGPGLISIEAPRLRSVAACSDYGYTLLEFKNGGNLSPSDEDIRELRTTKTYECHFWMHETRQWKEALLRPQFEGCPRSATSVSPILLVDVADGRPSFQSVPISEALILSLCGEAWKQNANIIYVAEGLRAPLFKADEYETAMDEILRLRRDDMISTLFPQTVKP